MSHDFEHMETLTWVTNIVSYQKLMCCVRKACKNGKLTAVLKLSVQHEVVLCTESELQQGQNKEPCRVSHLAEWHHMETGLLLHAQIKHVTKSMLGTTQAANDHLSCDGVSNATKPGLKDL